MGGGEGRKGERAGRGCARPVDLTWGCEREGESKRHRSEPTPRPPVSACPSRLLESHTLSLSAGIKTSFLIKIRKKKKIIEKHAQPDGKNNKNKRQTPLQDGRWVRISLHASSCIPILAVAGCPYTQSPRSRAGWRFPTAQKDAEKPPKERKPESTMRPIAAVPLTA